MTGRPSRLRGLTVEPLFPSVIPHVCPAAASFSTEHTRPIDWVTSAARVGYNHCPPFFTSDGKWRRVLDILPVHIYTLVISLFSGESLPVYTPNSHSLRPEQKWHLDLLASEPDRTVSAPCSPFPPDQPSRGQSMVGIPIARHSSLLLTIYTPSLLCGFELSLAGLTHTSCRGNRG